jgi:uncharacterized protein YcbK (DUF882 family)
MNALLEQAAAGNQRSAEHPAAEDPREEEYGSGEEEEEEENEDDEDSSQGFDPSALASLLPNKRAMEEHQLDQDIRVEKKRAKLEELKSMALTWRVKQVESMRRLVELQRITESKINEN